MNTAMPLRILDSVVRFRIHIRLGDRRWAEDEENDIFSLGTDGIIMPKSCLDIPRRKAGLAFVFIDCEMCNNH